MSKYATSMNKSAPSTKIESAFKGVANVKTTSLPKGGCPSRKK